MTNLNYTSTSGLKSASEDIDQAIINLTHHIHAAMEKHVLVLERSEQARIYYICESCQLLTCQSQTTATLLTQLLKAQADNTVLSAKLQEAEQLAPKLREAEEARDLAIERCKRAVNELNSTEDNLREHLSSCHSSTQALPVSARPAAASLRDRSLVLRAAPFRTSRDGNKSGEVIPGPSAK